jgi:hypothetical protein
MIEQPAQQLDQHHLEEPVGQQPVTAAHARGLREQQRERLLEAVDLISGRRMSAGSARTSGCAAPPSKSSVAQTKSDPSDGALWKSCASGRG